MALLSNIDNMFVKTLPLTVVKEQRELNKKQKLRMSKDSNKYSECWDMIKKAQYDPDLRGQEFLELG